MQYEVEVVMQAVAAPVRSVRELLADGCPDLPSDCVEQIFVAG